MRGSQITFCRTSSLRSSLTYRSLRSSQGWPIKKHTCNFIICERSAHLACSRCEEVWYCCKEHQKADWKAHKKCCGDLKLKRERTIAAQNAVESTIGKDGSKSGDSKGEQ